MPRPGRGDEEPVGAAFVFGTTDRLRPRCRAWRRGEQSTRAAVRARARRHGTRADREWAAARRAGWKRWRWTVDLVDELMLKHARIARMLDHVEDVPDDERADAIRALVADRRTRKRRGNRRLPGTGALRRR